MAMPIQRYSQPIIEDDDEINECDEIRRLPQSYSTARCRRICLDFTTIQDIRLVQAWLLDNTWPNLNSLVLHNNTQDLFPLMLPPRFPLLRGLYLERFIVVIPPTDLPNLTELHYYLQIDIGPESNFMTSQDRLVSLVSASRMVEQLHLRGSLCLSAATFTHSPPVPFPRLVKLYVEDEWKHLSESKALGYFAVPPTSQLLLFAHSNDFTYDLGNKGFWSHILPPDYRTTLPMLTLTRALRLIMGMNVHYETPGNEHGVPFSEGIVLSGATDPSGLSNGLATPDTPSTWFLAATDTQGEAEEAILVMLREIPQMLDCSKLLHLEMHMQIYFPPDPMRNEWQEDLLKHLVNLEYFEVGGGPSIKRVVSALTECESTLPKLTHLAFCYAAVPCQTIIVPQRVRVMLERRRERNRPLQRLTFLVPDQPRNNLADCKTLIPETNAMVASVQQLVQGLITVEVVRKYCDACHEADSEEDYASIGQYHFEEEQPEPDSDEEMGMSFRGRADVRGWTGGPTFIA